MSASPLLQCQQPGIRFRNRKGCWLLLYQTLVLLARVEYSCHAEGHCRVSEAGLYDTGFLHSSPRGSVRLNVELLFSHEMALGLKCVLFFSKTVT